MKRYEAMFLFDNTATHQWSEMEGEARRLCKRIEADLLVCVKFDERKLAYEIKGRKRGTYVLTYFDAEPDRIRDLEHDAGLSELILRTLVLRAEKLSEERLAELKAWPAEQPLQPSSGESRRGDGPPSRSAGRDQTARDKPKPAAEARTGTETETAPKPATDVATPTAPAAQKEDSPTPEAPPSEPATE